MQSLDIKQQIEYIIKIVRLFTSPFDRLVPVFQQNWRCYVGWCAGRATKQLNIYGCVRTNTYTWTLVQVGNMVKLYTNSGFKVINWVICAIISIPWPVFWLNQHPALMILEMFVHRVLTCPHHIEFLASYAALSQSPFLIAAFNFTKSLNFVRPRLYAMLTMAFCTGQQRALKVLLPITTSASTMAVFKLLSKSLSMYLLSRQGTERHLDISLSLQQPGHVLLHLVKGLFKNMSNVFPAVPWQCPLGSALINSSLAPAFSMLKP